MESLSYRTGDDAHYGGVDITISLTPQEADALGAQASDLADWFHSALWALAILRSGRLPTIPDALHADAHKDQPAGPGDWYTIINDLDRRLLPRLQGVRDAAIRKHAEVGGTLPNLALAMDVPKSTAQSRRNAVLNGTDRPSPWELWATDGGQHQDPSTDDLNDAVWDGRGIVNTPNGPVTGDNSDDWP